MRRKVGRLRRVRRETKTAPGLRLDLGRRRAERSKPYRETVVVSFWPEAGWYVGRAKGFLRYATLEGALEDVCGPVTNGVGVSRNAFLPLLDPFESPRKAGTSPNPLRG